MTGRSPRSAKLCGALNHPNEVPPFLRAGREASSGGTPVADWLRLAGQ